MISTQLVVVGGGPGGYAAAFLAADLGLSVALVDPEAESRRRLRLSRLHPVEGAAARREADRRVAPREGVGRRVRRAEGRSRQAPRVQEQRRQAADRRHRTARQGPQDSVRAGPGRDRRCASPAREADRRRRATSTIQFEHAILATGSTPAIPPALKVDDPRVMDSTARARSARHSAVAAGRRRRLHRPRARHRLRDARQRRHGGRDDGRPAAGRRSRSGGRPREARRRRR